MLGHRKLDANDYVAILKRRRWFIIVPLVLTPIIAFAITFFVPARYESQALVLIEGQRISSDIAPSITNQSLDSRLSSMSQQVLSRSQIQPIIVKYNLLPSKRLSMDDRVDLVRKAIGIKPIRSEIQRTGGLPGFFVTFTASDARTAQQVCSDITALFLTESLKNRQDAAEGTTDFLREQVDDAKRQLDDHDAKLAAFQQKYVGKLPGQETMNGNMLTSLNTQVQVENQDLARLEQQKDLQQSMLAQELQNAPAQPTPGPGGTASPQQAEYQELTALKAKQADLSTRYTPDYPDVIAIGREIKDLEAKLARTPAQPSSPSGNSTVQAPRPNESLGVIQLRAQIRAADIGIQAKKKELEQTQAAVAMYQERISSSPLVEQQFKDLNRDNETAQKNYDDLLVKMNHAKMAGDLERAQQGEQFRLMDDANLPEDPTFPNRQIFAAGGLFLGLMIGIALAALLEYKDTALRTEQDVWAFTQLPTLAVIAYSGNVEVKHKKPGWFSRFKALFHRKSPPELLTKAEG